MFDKIYIEITNLCNLACEFCHGTRRQGKIMSPEEFEIAAKKLKDYGKDFYLHIMGEPLSHPNLAQILSIAKENSMAITITTNGTLLEEQKNIIFESGTVKKVSISLHSFEGSGEKTGLEEYLNTCFDFAKECSQRKIICVFRLWNLNGRQTVGANKENDRILAFMEKDFTDPWKKCYNGEKLKEYVFLEWGEKFIWPDLNEQDYGESSFCYGLRKQIGVLSNGTVVPCCLDSDGVLSLGNIFESSLEEILKTEKAKGIINGFTSRKAVEELCRKCEYANRFKR